MRITKKIEGLGIVSILLTSLKLQENTQVENHESLFESYCCLGETDIKEMSLVIFSFLWAALRACSAVRSERMN